MGGGRHSGRLPVSCPLAGDRRGYGGGAPKVPTILDDPVPAAQDATASLLEEVRRLRAEVERLGKKRGRAPTGAARRLPLSPGPAEALGASLDHGPARGARRGPARPSTTGLRAARAKG